MKMLNWLLSQAPKNINRKTCNCIKQKHRSIYIHKYDHPLFVGDLNTESEDLLIKNFCKDFI